MADTTPLNNPFTGIEPYHCFGCDPEHPFGLKLQFERTGDLIRARWHPDKLFEGYPGVIHGGILATLADEIGAWFVYAVLGTAGVTRTLEMSYERPARREDGPLLIEASQISRSPKEAVIRVTIGPEQGETVAAGRCVYATFSEVAARKRFNYPGAEAFYPD